MCLASVLLLYDAFVIARLRNRNKQVHVQVDAPRKYNSQPPTSSTQPAIQFSTTP